MPIVAIDEEPETGGISEAVLFIDTGEYQFGICINDKPWICHTADLHDAELKETDYPCCRKVKRVYKAQSALIHLLDLQKSAHELAGFGLNDIYLQNTPIFYGNK